MSLKDKLMQAALTFVPDKKDPLIEKREHVGARVDRVDGKLKVTGAASFSAEYRLDNLSYAALVYSTIPRGRAKKIHTTDAEQAAGVIQVITHKNAPKMSKPLMMDPGSGAGGSSPDGLKPLDPEIHWNGQPLAIVIAETQDQAEYAASLIIVEYATEKSVTSFDKQLPKAKVPKDVLGQEPKIEVGKAEAALKKAKHSISATYRTPRYNHNALEPHATTAHWTEEGLVLFDATQNIYGVKNTVAKCFGLHPDKVEVVSPYVGGGFGSKGPMWQHVLLAAMAAKVVDRPVRLELSREGVFRIVGGRTPSEQTVRLGVDGTNKLVALIHEGTTATTENTQFAEQFSFPARYLYASETFHIEQRVVYLDTVGNTFMRAPGESIGTFALESAVDELAQEIGIDPIEFRKINEPKKDPLKGNDFSSRNLITAYENGAKKFGWNPQSPRTQRDGKWLIGQGCATAYYPYYRFPGGPVRMRVNNAGHAFVETAAHEMGMGTATVQIQHIADRLGLNLDQVTFEYGHSKLPESPQAGGSNQTASISTGIATVAEKMKKELFLLDRRLDDSPFKDMLHDKVEFKNGGIYSIEDSSVGLSFAQILDRAGKKEFECEATAGPPLEMMKYSMHSYGAQFCEVRVHATTGETRISRWVGSFDAGRILNPKTAESQFRGGIIMGIGMALTEGTLFDDRYGRIVNASYAEYHVPVHLDIPHIDILFTDIPDPQATLGARGIGEIGITGAAAAVANAVYNATAKRIRELPITLDKLM